MTRKRRSLRPSKLGIESVPETISFISEIQEFLKPYDLAESQIGSQELGSKRAKSLDLSPEMLQLFADNVDLIERAILDKWEYLSPQLRKDLERVSRNFINPNRRVNLIAVVKMNLAFAWASIKLGRNFFAIYQDAFPRVVTAVLTAVETEDLTYQSVAAVMDSPFTQDEEKEADKLIKRVFSKSKDEPALSDDEIWTRFNRVWKSPEEDD